MESKVTVLEPAGREEQIERWGLPTEHVGQRPHGGNFAGGHDAAPDDGEDDEQEQQLHQFLVDGGWTMYDARRGSRGKGFEKATGGARDAGMSAHRGVLHPGEHVDANALRLAVEDELGFTYDDVRAVYRQGPKSHAQLELRARIGARLLELSESGGQMLELGRALGWAVDEGGRGANCRTMERALERARKERN